jgi:hypothetical protein
MQEEEKKEEKLEGKKRKPYLKPELTAEELFEATVLSCIKGQQTSVCQGNKKIS